MRLRDFAENRRLPCVRITDEADIRDFPQLEIKRSLLTFLAFRELHGRPIPRTLEMDIPQTALPAFTQDELLTRFGEIGDHLQFAGVDARSTDLPAVFCFGLLSAVLRFSLLSVRFGAFRQLCYPPIARIFRRFG